MCGTDSARGDDEVVRRGHAARGFDDFGFFVGNDFDAFEVDAEREAVFGEPGRVGVDGFAAEDFVADDEAGGCVDLARAAGGGGGGHGGEGVWWC